jgi:hypothetical protein
MQDVVSLRTASTTLVRRFPVFKPTAVIRAREVDVKTLYFHARKYELTTASTASSDHRFMLTIDL